MANPAFAIQLPLAAEFVVVLGLFDIVGIERAADDAIAALAPSRDSSGCD